MEILATRRDPRYATALFRLLYTIAASGLALYSFTDANIWLWYAGGTESTQNCWDSSSGLTVSGLDADFNLFVASLVSLVFASLSSHYVASITPSYSNRNHAIWALRTNTATHIHSLSQHCLALGSIGIAYVFSNLNLLGGHDHVYLAHKQLFLALFRSLHQCATRFHFAKIPVAAMYKYVMVPSFRSAKREFGRHWRIRY
jgi:hypothetical protein